MLVEASLVHENTKPAPAGSEAKQQISQNLRRLSCIFSRRSRVDLTQIDLGADVPVFLLADAAVSRRCLG